MVVHPQHYYVGRPTPTPPISKRINQKHAETVKAARLKQQLIDTHYQHGKGPAIPTRPSLLTQAATEQANSYPLSPTTTNIYSSTNSLPVMESQIHATATVPTLTLPVSARVNRSHRSTATPGAVSTTMAPTVPCADEVNPVGAVPSNQYQRPMAFALNRTRFGFQDCVRQAEASIIRNSATQTARPRTASGGCLNAFETDATSIASTSRRSERTKSYQPPTTLQKHVIALACAPAPAPPQPAPASTVLDDAKQQLEAKYLAEERAKQAKAKPRFQTTGFKRSKEGFGFPVDERDPNFDRDLKRDEVFHKRRELTKQLLEQQCTYEYKAKAMRRKEQRQRQAHLELELALGVPSAVTRSSRLLKKVMKEDFEAQKAAAMLINDLSDGEDSDEEARIQRRLALKATNADPKVVERAREIAAKRFCEKVVAVAKDRHGLGPSGNPTAREQVKRDVADFVLTDCSPQKRKPKRPESKRLLSAESQKIVEELGWIKPKAKILAAERKDDLNGGLEHLATLWADLKIVEEECMWDDDIEVEPKFAVEVQSKPQTP